MGGYTFGHPCIPRLTTSLLPRRYGGIRRGIQRYAKSAHFGRNLLLYRGFSKIEPILPKINVVSTGHEISYEND